MTRLATEQFLSSIMSCCALTLLASGTTAAAMPRPAVARIVVAEKDGNAYGSGALVDVRGEYGLVVTNWHVVRDATGPIEVVFPDGFRSEARSLKLDEAWDLAALVIWRPSTAPLPLASTAPRPGDRLTICGYGSGDYREATGHCTEYYAPEVGLPHELVELSVEARQGDSGGPILNDRGEIAGVLFGAGQGTTLGSFGGRVGLFLASLAPGINQPRSGPIAPPTVIATIPDTPAAPHQTSPADAWFQNILSESTAPTHSHVGDRYANHQNPQQTDSLAAAMNPSGTASADMPPGTVQTSESPTKVPSVGDQVIAQTKKEQPQAMDAPMLASIPTEAAYVEAPSWLEDAKTIFALVGVAFVMLQLVRLAT